jgi:hypothetical protein
MRFFRAHRRPGGLLAIAALLLAQVALVAYACPLDSAPAIGAEMPCHETTGNPPEALCTAHCQAGAQSVDQAKPLASADFVAPLLAVIPAGAWVPRAPAVRAEPVLAHAPSPPLPILYHRFLN